MTGVVASAGIPPVFWLIMGVGLLLAGGIGFLIGQHFARGARERAFTRARDNLVSLFGLVVESVDSAQKACRALQSFPNLTLSEKQVDRLNLKQSQLTDTFAAIVGSQLELAPVEILAAPAPEPIAFNWERAPEDSLTNFPARAAFDANLEMLLAAGRDNGLQNGLLLIKIDKMDQLQRRFGARGVSEFTKRVGSLICRAIRDEDVVCRFSDAMFSVLTPQIDDEAGTRISESIRNTIRHHHFRLEEGGAEILVTASFGYTSFDSADNSDLILNQAGTALSKSEKRGRNQLHTYDGRTALLCGAS